MDSPDRSLFEPLERVLEVVELHSLSRLACIVEHLSQTHFQLAGCLVREGYGDNLVDSCAARTENRNDPIDELGCLAGSGRSYCWSA